MPDIKKGKLILTSVPTRTAKDKVRQYLITRLKNTPQEKIDALLNKLPIVLSSRIPEDKGRVIADQLIQLGATAVFEEHGKKKAPPPITQGAALDATTAEKSQKKIWGIKNLFIISFFILTLSGIWFFQSPNDTIPEKQQLIENNTPTPSKVSVSSKKQYSFAEPIPITAASLSVTAVPAKDMLKAYNHLYRFRPDTRFLEAYSILLKRHISLIGHKENIFQIGEITSNGKHVFLPIKKNNAVLQEIVLTLPLKFAEIKHSLAAVLDLLDQKSEQKNIAVESAKSPASNEPKKNYRFTQALASVNMVDPRYIAAALSIFEDLWRDGYNKAELLKATTRAYAMLLLTTGSNFSKQGDRLAAEALAFLVMAEHVDKTAKTAPEELLIAMAMGYRSHADTIVAHTDQEATSPEDQIISSYMRNDLKSLKRLVQENQDTLGQYLLTRHYREIGLFKEAERSAARLLKTFPTLYPSIIENIHSGPLNTAKVLTMLYPTDIVENIEQAIPSSPLQKFQSWKKKAAAYLKNESVAHISFKQFDKLLQQWKPYAEPDHYRFLIDSERLKDMYRMQYADAVYSRYKVLFKRWGVIDQAKSFVDAFIKDDSDHPLVLLMHGKVYSQLGEHAKAEQSLQAAVRSPENTGMITRDALAAFSDPLKRFKLLPVAVDRIDGRPKNRLWTGYLLQEGNKNLDMAVRYYESALAQDPYQFWVYRNLAHAQGSDHAFQQALPKSQHSYQFLEQAAKYYTDIADQESLEQAASLYGMALELAPSVSSMVQDYAQVLIKLERFEEAVLVLNAWLQQYSGKGLDTVITRAHLATVYLQQGEPETALQTLRNDIDSYQAGVILNVGKAYTMLGRIKEAGIYYQKALERYPTVKGVITDTAEFYWQQGQYEQAAELIAHGRSLYGKGDNRWYLASFFKSFQNIEQEKILQAIALLKKTGASPWELSALGHSFADAKKYKIAFSILSDLKGQGRMENLELIASAYKLLLQWQGEEKASAYLNEKISTQQRGPMLMVLYKLGFYEAIVHEVGDPDSYPKYQEFIWLQLLIARLFTDGGPDTALSTHYAKQSSDPYNIIGQYLLGSISTEDLLNKIKTDKQRCEFAYYIGLKERLAGNLAAASHWYQICTLTFLQRNGEFHWANTELFWWAHAGLNNRHRLMTEDIKAYREKEARKIQPKKAAAPAEKNTIKV